MLTNLPERFQAKIEVQPDGCWLWTGARNPTARWAGYGVAWWKGANRLAHRLIYELLVGPVPEGLVLDHLCRVPICVNPEHLEPVTQEENRRRSAAMGGALWDGTVHGNAAVKAAAAACAKGHPWGPNPVRDKRGHRVCRECRRDNQRKRRAAQ